MNKNITTGPHAPPHSLSKLASLYRLTGKAVMDYEMIQPGDRLLVGISGGVDSMILMHALERLKKRAPIEFDLFAVTIDEGFKGIVHTPLATYAKEQGWNLKIIETPISELILEKGTEDKPCGLCSRLRRGFIHRYADEIGANKLVLGHHRDDLCVSLLMGLFRGTGLKTMGPNVPADSGTKRVIRPLCYVPKKLIESCAEAFEFPNTGTCDYGNQLDESGDRAKLERILKELETDFPNLGTSMLHSMKEIRPGYLLDHKYLNLK
jgi:tRNA 2-thiocytidine biosynthesis protein TtcA